VKPVGKSAIADPEAETTMLPLVDYTGTEAVTIDYRGSRHSSQLKHCCWR
jgi:hypothetical protein